jgi:hypothetical protein
MQVSKERMSHGDCNSLVDYCRLQKNSASIFVRNAFAHQTDGLPRRIAHAYILIRERWRHK